MPDDSEITCTITVWVIAHDKQRYPTAGDWQWSGDHLDVRVSRMGVPEYERLIALHEITEALLAKWCNIDERVVDEFDMQFEEDRATGLHDFPDEPGDDPACPIYEQHQVATITEREGARLLGVNWNHYAKAVDEL